MTLSFAPGAQQPLEVPIPRYLTPGLYREDVVPVPAPGLRTGVPAFLGLAAKGPTADAAPGEDAAGQDPLRVARRLSLWSEFEALFGPPPAEGYLGHAVRGFFANGGALCYVVRLADTSETALQRGLAVLERLDAIDLVCAPDVMSVRDDQDRVLRMQGQILTHCDRLGTRFAILDALPGADTPAALQQRAALRGANGALYYPWVGVLEEAGTAVRFVPPCGHVAGVYARTDDRAGVHKAPANEVVEGVQDLERNLTDAAQRPLNDANVNCLRAFPGRGIRVWGARTLAADPAWRYVNVRRLFITAARWIERNMADTVFAPSDARLWDRIARELTAYFAGQFRRGALRGRSPQEAFYVRCDAELNPPEVRDQGSVVAEIGLAPAIPNEFVVVRIVHGASGVTVTGPAGGPGEGLGAAL